MHVNVATTSYTSSAWWPASGVETIRTTKRNGGQILNSQLPYITFLDRRSSQFKRRHPTRRIAPTPPFVRSQVMMWSRRGYLLDEGDRSVEWRTGGERMRNDSEMMWWIYGWVDYRSLQVIDEHVSLPFMSNLLRMVPKTARPSITNTFAMLIGLRMQGAAHVADQNIAFTGRSSPNSPRRQQHSHISNACAFFRSFGSRRGMFT